MPLFGFLILRVSVQFWSSCFGPNQSYNRLINNMLENKIKFLW